MKEVYAIEVGLIKSVGKETKFIPQCVSSEAYTKMEDAVSFIEKRNGNPSKLESMNLVWRTDWIAYRIAVLTIKEEKKIIPCNDDQIETPVQEDWVNKEIERQLSMARINPVQKQRVKVYETVWGLIGDRKTISTKDLVKYIRDAMDDAEVEL